MVNLFQGKTFMPSPLSDITIYYWGEKIKDAPKDFEFRHRVNYICDFYHKMLLGYKPTKTSRICIHLEEGSELGEPSFFGSICSISSGFDENKYLQLSIPEQYKYLLNIINASCLHCAEILEWDKDVFIDAFNEVHKRDFLFYLDYPKKNSRDKKKAAFVRLVKTELSSTLYLNFIERNETKEIKLLQKKNWWWYDPMYELAKNSKWLDTSTFGVSSKNLNKYSYYSLIDEVVITNIKEESTPHAK